jgi:hypothetical protein
MQCKQPRTVNTTYPATTTSTLLLLMSRSNETKRQDEIRKKNI